MSRHLQRSLILSCFLCNYVCVRKRKKEWKLQCLRNSFNYLFMKFLNKTSIAKLFFTLSIYLSIYRIAFSSNKIHLAWIRREICTDQVQFTSENSSKQILLFFLSFWRHPFTAEHPLVSKWYNAKFLQICPDEETNSSTSWMAWEWVNVQQIFIYGLTIPLIFAFLHLTYNTFLSCNPPVEIEDHYLRSSHRSIINISHRWGYFHTSKHIMAQNLQCSSAVLSKKRT